MVRSIFMRQDAGNLDAMFQAAVTAYPDDPGALLLQIWTTRLLPPHWLETIRIALVHDDGRETVPCIAEYDGHRTSPSCFKLTPEDPAIDLRTTFRARDDSFYLAVSLVEVRTGQDNRKKLANQTSLSDYRERTDVEDPTECLVTINDLFPSR